MKPHAIILAAGRGSRMEDQTEGKPKGMVSLFGKPLVQHQLDALSAAGISNIHMVTGYLAEHYSTLGLDTFHNENWANTNMVSSLICADDLLRKAPSVISYSDIFYDEAYVTALMNSDDECCITYDPNWATIWQGRFEDPLSDAETFKLDKDSFLLEIGRKPSSMEEVEGQYMGLLKFTPPFWSRATTFFNQLSDEQLAKLDMTSFLRQMILRGEKIRALSAPGLWGEVDDPSDLKFYENSETYKKKYQAI